MAKEKKIQGLDKYANMSLFRKSKTSIINNRCYHSHYKANFFQSDFSTVSKLAYLSVGQSYLFDTCLSKTEWLSPQKHSVQTFIPSASALT